VNPDTARDYVYVDDVCDAYLAAATRALPEPGAVYNIGSGRQTTLREVVEVARRLLSIDAEPQWGTMPGRVWDTSVWVADNRRARAELGWAPRHDLESGLRCMLAHWLEHPQLAAWYEERSVR
jgi:dolichol-phosphate mannosyltransferase